MSKAWMPMYWGDYLADTLQFSTLQHGAYLLLIAHYWQHGGLPTDAKELQKICKFTPHQWTKNFEALAKYFLPGWRHKRIDAELEKSNIIRLKRQVYGAKGGLASRGKTNMERHISSKQLLKQKGDQSQSHKNLTYFDAYASRKRPSEEER